MVRQCRKLTAAGVLLSAAFSLSASAEPKTEAAKAGKATPPPQATAAGLDKQEKVKSDKPQVNAEKAEAKADKAEDRAEAKADKAEAKAEAKAERAENEADVKHPAVGHEGHGEGGAHHHGRGKFKSAVSELR
jgi:Skp family chaperone for outer membrane proteins